MQYVDISSSTNIIEAEHNTIPEVKIFSIQGALLLHAKGNEIDLSSLPSGIYVAKVDGVFLKVVKR
jgi:hypothetical protein